MGEASDFGSGLDEAVVRKRLCSALCAVAKGAGAISEISGGSGPGTQLAPNEITPYYALYGFLLAVWFGPRAPSPPLAVPATAPVSGSPA